MKTLRRALICLMLSLVLGTCALAVDSLTGGTGLTGRRFLVLGDSYTAGYGLEDVTLDWSYLLADQYGMTQLNYSISGSTLAAGPVSFEPMVRRCLSLPEETPDFVLIQGGSNDYFKSIPIGSASSRDPETVCGALNRIIDTLREKYPEAALIGFTPWVSDETVNKIDQTQQAYTDAMLEVFRLRGLLCYDASDTASNGMYMRDRDFRTQYALTPGDWYHLSAEGHAMFAPVFARWLEENYLHLGLNEQYYDLATVSDLTRSAVSKLLDAGIAQDAGEHLYAPTRQATRGELALCLYRMAGSPEAQEITFEDVEDQALLPAVSWAVSAGIFSREDQFRPDRPVTREMLAAVLYRYYTEYLDRTVDRYVGVGSYADGRAVSEYARIPFGWALETFLLTPEEELLHPAANMSRGGLAVALAELMDLTGR